MASACQALLTIDVASKYRGGVTCGGYLDVKSASQLPIFSYAETLMLSCKFSRNSVARNPALKCSVAWFRVSPSAQQAVTDSLKSELWGCLPKIKSSAKKFGKGNERKVGWNFTCCSYGERSSEDYGAGGDPQTQDILVEMVKLEVSKVQMAEFVDESSRNIQKIGLQTQLEYDKLVDSTTERLDASGNRVLSQLDANAYAFLKELNLTNSNLEEQSRTFEEFHILATYSRNDGLFFKNLYKAPRILAHRSNLSTFENRGGPVSPSITQKDFTRSYKQILYGGISLVFLSFMWSSGSVFLAGTYMRASKLVSYGVIMALLLTQLAYAEVLTGEADTLKQIEDKSD